MIKVKQKKLTSFRIGFIIEWEVAIFIMILLLFHNVNLKYKLVLLHITHPQSIFPKFLILVLNSDTGLLDLISLGRLFPKMNGISTVIC